MQMRQQDCDVETQSFNVRFADSIASPLQARALNDVDGRVVAVYGTFQTTSIIACSTLG
jgi:hypothetical protein